MTPDEYKKILDNLMLIMDVAIYAALPDSIKQALYDEAKKEKPDDPLYAYFDKCLNGRITVKTLLNELKDSNHSS